MLRELLKQDRSSPLPEQAHRAWLTAYDKGLMDHLEPGQAAAALPDKHRQLAGGD